MKPTPEQRNENGREKLAWLLEQSRSVKLDLIQNHLSICQIMLNELFEEEVIEYAGERYSHDKPKDGQYSRWGYNPGSVQVGDKRLKMEVPRIRNMDTGKFVGLNSYDKMRHIETPTDQLLKGVLKGLSMRDYDGVIDYLGEAFGLSKSSISRSFKERTTQQLEEFENRDLSVHDFVAIFIDGKYLAKEQIMIVLGVTMRGDKIPIGFLQTHSENSVPIKDLFDNLIERGLKYGKGLLFVIDGGKGIRKAVEEVFGNNCVIQRCTWHKRENVEKYLKEEDQMWFRAEYHSALEKPTYKQAKEEMDSLVIQLEKVNMSASRSLKEGIDGGILTLHQLGLNTVFNRSFHTTNVIENLNSQLEKYVRKVKYWKNSNMRYRWIAAGLIEIEHKMNRISNYKKLPELRKAIFNYISDPSRNDSEISTKAGT